MKPNRFEVLVKVAAELNNIIAKATESELANLNHSSFTNSNSSNCLYGQLTGSYKSDRAKEITPKTYSTVCDEYDDDYFDKGICVTILEKYLQYLEYSSDTCAIKEIFSFIKGDIKIITLSLDESHYTTTNSTRPYKQMNEGVVYSVPATSHNVRPVILERSHNERPVNNGFEIKQVKELKF